MSDGDDPEGFDREAQKRELREKYAKDAEDRERTGRMSELLLQGATMTNKHCDRCGNPRFRYEGREFCPTCQAEGEPDAADAAEAAADTSTGPDTTAAAPKTGNASVDATAAGDSQAAANDATAAGDSAPATGAPTRSVTNVADVDAESPEAHTHDVHAEPTESPNATAESGTAPRADVSAGMTAEPARGPGASAAGERDRNADTPAARAALSRSVARLAERAAAADDPRSARELAEAAREAAAALDALR